MKRAGVNAHWSDLVILSWNRGVCVCVRIAACYLSSCLPFFGYIRNPNSYIAIIFILERPALKSVCLNGRFV